MYPSRVCIIRFDFFLADNKPSVREQLGELYAQSEISADYAQFFGLAPESDVESRGSAVVERFANLDRHAFEGAQNPFDAFEQLQTFLIHQDSRRFLDCVTVGILTSTAIDSVTGLSDQEQLEKFKQWQQVLGRIGNEVESLIFRELFAEDGYPLLNHPAIVYIDVDELDRVDPWHSNGDIAARRCLAHLERLTCFPVTDGCISAFASGEVMTTQDLGQVWGPLLAVNVVEPKEEYTFQTTGSVNLPPCGTLLNRFIVYFRSYDWAHFRLLDIDIIVDELIDTTQNVMGLDIDDEQEYLRKLAGQEEEVGRLQNYLDYSEITKEREDITYLIDSLTSGREGPESTPTTFEYPISEPTDTTLRSTLYFSDSLLATYQDELTHLLTKLEDELDSLDERQARISEIITDRINIAGTQASVQLNDRVGKLTVVLVGLTLLLLIGRETLSGIVTTIPPVGYLVFLYAVSLTYLIGADFCDVLADWYSDG